MTTVAKVLLDHLYELLEKEFNSFKFYMTDGMAQGFSPIPRGTLENTSREQVVELMKSRYGWADAGKIAVQVLQQMQQNNLADQLKEKLATVQDQTNQANQVDGAAAHAPVAPGAPGAPAAPGVQQTITADSSSNVSAPVLSGGVYHGPVTMNFK